MYSKYLVRPFHKPIFHIETDNMNLYQNMNIAFGDFFKDEYNGDLSVVYPLAFYQKDGRFILKNRQIEEEITEEEYALQAIEDIIYEKTVVDENILAIHSGVVAYKNKGFILAGFSKAGKSTLTAYLYSKGFEYLSDDLALIRKDNLHLIPYNRPLQLRIGGYEVLKRYGIDFSGTLEFKYGDLHKIVVYPEKPRNTEYETGGIFFIKRTEDDNKIVEVPKQKMIIMLMKNQYIFSSPDAELLKVYVNLSKIKAYEIYYSDMDYVKNILIGEANE